MSENDMNEAAQFPERIIPDPTAAAIAAELARPEEEDPGAGQAVLPPPVGLSILAAMAGDEEAADASSVSAKADVAQSAAGSYGYDKAIAEGKWVKWPKLGPSARLYLAKTQNKAWKTKMNRLRKVFGDDNGVIDQAVFTDKLLGPLMVESVFLGMEGVIVEPGQPELANSKENRLRLFEDFEGLKDEVLVYCSAPKNFRDNSEAIVKNS